jgi:3-hydroxyacyl-CoA dehydrogenase
VKVLGPDAEATLYTLAWGMEQGGYATAYDIVVARKVAHVLAGGNRAPGSDITEQELLDLEREAFVSLCGEEKTQARMQHLLMNGKPLRN